MKICSWKFVLWRLVQKIYPFKNLGDLSFEIFQEICPFENFIFGDFSFLKNVLGDLSFWNFLGDFSFWKFDFRRFFLFEIFFFRDLSFWNFVFRRFFLYEKCFRRFRGCLDLLFSITHNSVFIAHNLKLMGPMVEGFVWICFQFLFPSLNSLIFEW